MALMSGQGDHDPSIQEVVDATGACSSHRPELDRPAHLDC